MKAKKTVSVLAAAAMLGGAAPVFADHDNFRTPAQIAFQRQQVAEANGGGHAARVHHPQRAYRGHRGQPVYQAHPAYHGGPAYRGGPAYHGYPAYAEPVPVYEAAPVYAGRPDNSAAILGGAALGAMLGSQIGDHHSRPAAMAFGAVFGAILGSELSDR